MNRLLNGVRVLDASRVLAGPYCGQLLADLGADVIKLERPGPGDDTRSWGPPFDSATRLSAYFMSCNRGKRSIAVDLSTPQGLDLFHRIIAKCDVLIENFRSDTAHEFDLCPPDVLKRHPHLIACSITGFGRTGPMNNVPGYDFAVQALSGLMSITGPVDGPPYKVGVALADILTGLHASTAILAALHARKSSGHGYAIDLSLLDCALASQVNTAQAYLTGGKVPVRQGNAHLQIVPYQLFATADGFIVVNVGNDSQFGHFCSAIEQPAWSTNPRFITNPDRVRNRAVLIPLIETVLRNRATEEWVERFERHAVPHAVVGDYARVFDDPQVRHRGMRMQVTDPSGRPVDLIGSPFHITPSETSPPRFPPTQVGMHTEEVLRELGIDTDGNNR